MTSVAILPYTYKPNLDECLATLQLPSEVLLVVDETPPNNRGLSAAVSDGIRFMQKQAADWLIVLNPQMRFGASGGLDMLDSLVDSQDNLVYFYPKDGEPTRQSCFAWHCCAINRRVIELIGKLDPNFYPTYFDDVDYELRYRKHFGDEGIGFRPIDAINTGSGQSVELAGLKVDTNYLITYFASKWGIHPSAVGSLDSYAKPFNEPNNSLGFFPPAHGEVWND